MTATTLYEHDCDHCTYLGQSDGANDLYWCFQGGRPTVIARWGSGGPQYISGVRVAEFVHCPALQEAERRAAELGLPLTIQAAEAFCGEGLE